MMYDISEVSRLFSISPSGLRYYEEQGLISPMRTESGRRKYTEADLKGLLFLRSMHELGISTEEMKRYFHYSNQSPTAEAGEVLLERAEEMEKKAAYYQVLARCLRAQGGKLHRAEEWEELHVVTKFIHTSVQGGLRKEFYEIWINDYCGNAMAYQKNNQCFMILSEAIKNEYVEVNAVPFTSRVSVVSDFTHFDENMAAAEASGYTAIVKADTLEELAQKMEIDPQGLKKTVEEYNALCAAGSDPLGKSAEFLKPIEEGPYYAASYFPSAYGTLGGIKINSKLEVVTDEDVVIPGLYSAGTDSCTIYGDSYMFLLPGNTMGYSVNSGRFAGEHAAQYLGK